MHTLPLFFCQHWRVPTAGDKGTWGHSCSILGGYSLPSPWPLILWQVIHPLSCDRGSLQRPCSIDCLPYGHIMTTNDAIHHQDAVQSTVHWPVTYCSHHSSRKSQSLQNSDQQPCLASDCGGQSMFIYIFTYRDVFRQIHLFIHLHDCQRFSPRNPNLWYMSAWVKRTCSHAGGLRWTAGEKEGKPASHIDPTVLLLGRCFTTSISAGCFSVALGAIKQKWYIL